MSVVSSMYLDPSGSPQSILTNPVKETHTDRYLASQSQPHMSQHKQNH